MHKGLQVLFWNVRSVYNKIVSIRQEIDLLAPDILNISETWLQEQLSDHFVGIINYSLVRSDRTLILPDGYVKRGGGICTYIKQGLNFTVITDLSICNNDIAMSVIEYSLPHTRKIYILNVYRPPSGDVDNYLKNIQECINTLRTSGKLDFFIGGDFNVDIKHKNLVSSNKLPRFLKINQFKQYITQITRPDSNSTIDLIISNCEIVKECGTLDVNISDHLTIYLIRKKNKVKIEKVNFRGRSYRNLVDDELRDKLLDYDWTNFGDNGIDDC